LPKEPFIYSKMPTIYEDFDPPNLGSVEFLPLSANWSWPWHISIN